MAKIKIILGVLGIAVLFTGLSFFFKAEESLIEINGAGNYMITRGFPGHFLENHYTDEQLSNKISTNFLFVNFILDILIYFVIILAVRHLINLCRKTKNWVRLASVIIFAIIWFIIDIRQSEQCVTGFPIAYLNKCATAANISSGFVLYGTIVDFLFWFAIFSLFFSVLHLLSQQRIGKWRYIIAPIFISLMSFWYYTPCTGMFCIFTGRGFPLPFFTDNIWNWAIFGIDFLVWALVLYPLARLIFWLVHKIIIKK